MNCNTCRYELSQCLDGRLPSGRRTLVMEHAAGCEPCATFWKELQAAQALALQLPKHPVSDGFREQLWQRIRAGEGTPAAVFHEPVALFTKVRYALTGAAAAAALLLTTLWLRDDRRGSPTGELVVRGGTPAAAPAPVTAMPHDPVPDVDDLPLFSSTQPLTAGLLAMEAAKGFEQRRLLANATLARLGQSPWVADSQVDQVLEYAREARDLGAALIDLRDRGRLLFRDAQIDADLQVAVTMLARVDEPLHGFDAVRKVVQPALRSGRLGTLSREIYAGPSLDQHEEQQELVYLHARRPEVLPMLFFSFGPAEISEEFGLHRKVGVFLVDDECGPAYVVPRSQFAVGMQRLQLRSTQRPAGGARHLEVKIERR